MADKNYHLWPLIVVALLARTRAQGVQPTGTDVTVFQGETGLLTCSGSTVSWNRVVQQSASSPLVTQKIFTSPDTWHGDRSKYDINGTYNLIIKDAQARTDGGIYQCNTNENQNAFLNTNFLVLESLVLQVEPEGHLTRGVTIEISCTVRYGGPATMSTEQEPMLVLTLDKTSAFPTGQVYYTAPAAGTNFHEKTRVVNYTLSDDTPGRHLRCTVRSMSYEKEEKQMLNIRFAPVITQIVEREYNTSDNITCSADGIPEPRVTWTRISGSMPESMSGLSGRRQAVLKNLENGEHVWMCTATNELGSVSVNVSFTVQGVAVPEPSTGASKIGIAIGLAVGLGVPIIIAIIVVVCLLMRRKKDKKQQPPVDGGGLNNQPTDLNKQPPINDDRRPPRPVSDVNVNPNPTYQTPVYPEQYGDSPAKPPSDKPGFGDLGVRPIHAGGSTPSLNRSYESSQRESGTDDRFQGPNTSV